MKVNRYKEVKDLHYTFYDWRPYLGQYGSRETTIRQKEVLKFEDDPMFEGVTLLVVTNENGVNEVIEETTGLMAVTETELLGLKDSNKIYEAIRRKVEDNGRSTLKDVILWRLGTLYKENFFDAWEVGLLM